VLCERFSALKEGCEVDETWLDAMAISLQGMLDHTRATESNIAKSRATLDAANVLKAPDVPEEPRSSAGGFEASPAVSLRAAVEVSKDMHDHHQDCPTELPIQGSELTVVSKSVQSEGAAIAELNHKSVPVKAEKCTKDDEKGNPTSIDVDVGPGHECRAEGSTTNLGGSVLPLSDATVCNDDDDLDFVPLATTACLPSPREKHSRDCIGPSAKASVPRIAVLDVLPLDSIAPPVGAHSIGMEVSNPKDRRGDDDEKGADEDDNAWLRVGGGLAIVGAIVGGAAALTLLHGNGPNDRKRGANEEPKSKQ
jgi:hypothetical protein